MSCKLNDVCELIVDCPHSTEPDEGEGYPIIRTPNIGVGYLDLEGVQRVSKAAYDRRNIRAVPRPNDLILAREAPAGNVGIIREGMKVCLGQRTVLIRPSAEKVSPLFLNYYLNAPKQRHALLSNSNGATVSHVNMPVIRNLVIELPDREAQDRIADVLSAYDELIENSRRQIQLLEEAARRLYKEWFIDLKFPGHETTPIVDGLPEGWCKATLGELSVLITRGITPRYSETSDFLVLGQRCVRGNLVDLSCARRCERKSIAEQKMLKCGDVLINSTGTGSLGRTAQVWFDPIDMTVDSHVTIVRASSPELSSYLAQWAFANESFIESLHTGSTGQTELPRERVSSIRVLVPSSGALNQFNSFVSPMVGKVNMLQRSIAAAREARDRLLPKLMSGEIEV